VLISLDNRLFSAVPADNPVSFMSHFLHAAMFGVYGVVFLILNRDLGGADSVGRGLDNRIRVFRAEHDLRQADLAAAIGVSRKTISAIEVGRFVPSTDIALRIARHFVVPVESVFSLNGRSDPTAESPSVPGLERAVCVR